MEYLRCKVRIYFTHSIVKQPNKQIFQDLWDKATGKLLFSRSGTRVDKHSSEW